MEKLETYGKKPIWLRLHKKLFMNNKKGFITLSSNSNNVSLRRWIK